MLLCRGLRNVLLFWGPEINWIHGRKRNSIKIGHPAAPDWGGRGAPYEWKSQHSRRHLTKWKSQHSGCDTTWKSQRRTKYKSQCSRLRHLRTKLLVTQRNNKYSPLRSPEGNRIGIFIVLHVALSLFPKRRRPFTTVIRGRKCTSGRHGTKKHAKTKNG